MKILAVIVLITLTTNIYSFENHDENIAKIILDTYGDNITLDKINQVLEYDESNSGALIKKVKLLIENNSSLYKIIEIIDNNPEIQDYLVYEKLLALYSLGMYEDIVTDRDYFLRINEEFSFFYIVDSHLRLGKLKKDILEIALYQYPDSSVLKELDFLINDKKLTIYNDLEIQSIIRLYPRVEDKRKQIWISEKLHSYFSNMDLSNKLVYNYPVLREMLYTFDYSDLNGIYIFDYNSDLHPETKFTILNNKISEKNVDVDGDRVYETSVKLLNGTPYEVSSGDFILRFSDYPYVGMVGNKNVRYNFLNNKNLFPIFSLLNSRVNNLSLVKEEFISSKVIMSKEVERWIYRDDETVVVYKDDSAYLIKEGVIVKGVRDMDGDGEYDIHEKYIGGVNIGALHVEGDNYLYYEGYEPFDFQLFSDDNYIKDLIIEESDRINLSDYNLKMSSLIEIELYNWWQ